ncbi:MAG: hypothetical protein GY746_14695 [Gammaproteobacteria bacterium]|nr:hypothetical protein [Gammaproteobacteria bacterium]
MNFIKTLLGKEKKKPTWEIKSPTEPPASRKKPIFDESLPSQVRKGNNPFLDDNMLDTIELEAEAAREANPYNTLSWEQELDNDTRKLKTTQIDKETDKPTDSQYNPYNTSSIRRGWKK